jgi:plastocyanin
MLLVARIGRASRLAAVASVAISLLAACSGDAAITPLPSGAALPTDCAAADADSVITLSARNLEFSAPCLIAPADTVFTIHFTNEESIPHDVALYADSSKETEYFRGEVITGPDASIDYRVDPISAGDHFFDCIVHPSMKGTLYVR